MPIVPLMKEDHISQIPALQLLQNLGWQYLTPLEANKYRNERASAVLLDGILEKQLRSMNTIQYRGEEYPFSEANIHTAIQALKEVLFDGLVRTNEKIYDLLCLGKSLQQSIHGDIKSFTIKYIDWEHPERNVYHVTEEFEVERAGRKDRYIPDIVLFVNGIPLVVIECKRTDLGPGKDPIEEAISQHIRNQKEDGVPQLFIYTQLLMAVSKNQAKYGTTGTPRKFWALWREEGDHEDEIKELINRPLSSQKKDKLFAGRFSYVRKYFDQLEAEGGRQVTEQDRAIWSLCRPERLLELSHRYILFDAGEKKIARYQQYFCVRKLLERIGEIEGGCRKGGVVWHTQGSGKSLTMVMLAKAIAMEKDIDDYKIVLVTDRVDLDDQIYRTFKHCDVELDQASTGSKLVEMLKGKKHRIITTVINKFEAAVSKQGVRNEDRNIFVLVDEGHRTQYGSFHAKMRKSLPNACFIGFTGTPIVKKNKNTINRFGGLIRPPYTIQRAVQDKAVVPLLYEGRHVREKVDKKAIDEWFERITENLSNEQKADLKRKFSTEDMLMQAEPVVREIAWDVSKHFRDNWQHTPFKAQLVAPNKATALLYKDFLDEFEMVHSEVLISGPDEREGEEDIYKENKEKVIRFWKAMMNKYGTEKEYNRQLINAFKFGEPEEGAPEIIIVVHKLLTGFDAPRNTVLYITRQLKEHTLLQAIARVNRLHDGKDYGYVIDYRGVLENLDHALDLYNALPDFDMEDLEGMLTDVHSVIEKLPQKQSEVWDIFKDISNKRDEEAFERLLADDALRVRFYEKFSDFARTFGIAISTVSFLENTPQNKIDEYREDLGFFRELRSSVRRRYAEVIDFSEYEPKIKKLLDTNIGTEGVEQIVGAIDLFDEEQRAKAMSESDSDAAKADMIAHNTKRVLEIKWRLEDPAFYQRFSKLLQDLIDAFRANRIREAGYLNKALEIEKQVLRPSGEDVPQQIRNNEIATSFFRNIYPIFEQSSDNVQRKKICADASLAIANIINKNRIVNWTVNIDCQNRMRQFIEDYLFELKDNYKIDFTFENIDLIMDRCIEIAKVRLP